MERLTTIGISHRKVLIIIAKKLEMGMAYDLFGSRCNTITTYIDSNFQFFMIIFNYMIKSRDY